VNPVYLDTSALIKRYVEEAGSDEVARLLEEARTFGTLSLTRVEAYSALSKAVRTRALSAPEAQEARAAFEADWPYLAHLRLLPAIEELASTLAWEDGLRGYEAVHLAAALYWEALLGTPILFATYDHNLHAVAFRRGLSVFPELLG
jgi:predicted nucleic acid-binding protein